MKYLKKYCGQILLICYIIYIPISWMLVLRDGRAVYAILDFYPMLTPLFKSIEPHLVDYGINSIPTIIFFALGFVTFSLYILSFYVHMPTKKIVIFAILFQAITFFSYPSLSTDIFSYIFSDRIVTVYNQNVWKTKPITHSNDPFSRLSDWQNNTRVYGGINQAVYTVVSKIGGNNLLGLVFLYKSVTWVFAIAAMWVVYLIAKKHFKGREAISLQIIFWNPLFIVEILGSGHNDILMIFLMLVSLHYFLQEKVWLAGIAIALAFQVKIIAFVLFLFLFIEFCKKRSYKDVIIFSLSFVIVNAIIFFFMDIDPLSYGKAIVFNTGIYWQGLPALLHRFYTGEKPLVFLGFSLTCVIFFYLQIKKHIDPITLYGGLITLYLLFFASAYWNWYVLWVLCFVPFIRSPRLAAMVVALSFTSFLLYPVYWVALRFNYQHIFWSVFFYMTMIGLPILIYFLPTKYTHYLLKQQ